MSLKDNERLMEELEERHKRVIECIDEWGKSVDNPERQKKLLDEIDRLQQVDLETINGFIKNVENIKAELAEFKRRRNN